MGWPVEWLQRMMSAKEFDRWCEFYRHHPFDDESVHNAPLALLTSIYVNAHQPKGVRKTNASDFLLFRDRTEKPVDLDAKFRAFFGSLKPSSPA